MNSNAALSSICKLILKINLKLESFANLASFCIIKVPSESVKPLNHSIKLRDKISCSCENLSIITNSGSGCSLIYQLNLTDCECILVDIFIQNIELTPKFLLFIVTKLENLSVSSLLLNRLLKILT